MRRSSAVLVLVCSLLIAGILAGCARSDAVPAEFPTSLQGTRWKVIEWRGGDDLTMGPVEGFTGEIRFVSAQSVKVTADPGPTWNGLYYDRMAEFEQTFVIAELETQGMDIPAPARRFAILAGQTRSYVRADDTLTLQDREGEKLLVLEKVR